LLFAPFREIYIVLPSIPNTQPIRDQFHPLNLLELPI